MDNLIMRHFLVFLIIVNLSCAKTEVSETGLEDVANVDAVVTNKNLNLKIGETFYWQLKGAVKLNKNADIYDIDLEDNEYNGIIKKLTSQGKKVICYISAGTYENWRSDAKEFPTSSLGKNLAEWPGEKWIDFTNPQVREIMKKRIYRAKKAGCAGIEPDNTDGYTVNNGVGLTEAQTISYLKWFADTAHGYGLVVGLKNSLDLIKKASLHKKFDFSVNEQCYQYSECKELLPFINEGKPVFIAEYGTKKIGQCLNANQNGFSLAFYNLDLDGTVFRPCW